MVTTIKTAEPAEVLVGVPVSPAQPITQPGVTSVDGQVPLQHAQPATPIKETLSHWEEGFKHWLGQR